MWPFDCPDNELREYVEHLREHVAHQAAKIEALEAYLGVTVETETHAIPLCAREDNVYYPARWRK